MTLKIFISYSQEDSSPEARYLQNYLSKHIPDSDVFIDKVKPKGVKWREINDQSLLASDVFVVILTNGAIQSSEVKREVELAKSNSNRKIIPCKDDLMKSEWSEMPWGLNDYDGIEYERKEELGRKLVGAIKTDSKDKQQIRDYSYKTKPIPIALTPYQNIDLKYQITNGEILAATLNRGSQSLIIELTSFGDGELVVILPRHVIDAKYNEEDDVFFVLVNTAEADFEETTDEEQRILKISFEEGTQEIEIIGTQIFGTSFSGSAKEENVIRILKGSSSPHDGKYLDKEILTISIGEKVRWINEDLAAHTITSGTLNTGPDGVFDSSLFMPSKSFETTFNHVGTYDYFCVVHPWKTGKIIVK
ncbi:MAG: TIR domain-containing protein [Candidatus Nitrosotenuis sp.]